MSTICLNHGWPRCGVKAALTALVLSAGAACHAQEDWLTVSGDPANPAVNTIQVQPVPVQVGNDSKVMRVRVSRSHRRTSWDGIAYRSYVSTVQFDCAANTARYEVINFFAQPLWAGESHQKGDYTTGTPRMMEFRDVSPNPNARILRAACAGVSRAP